MTTALRRALLTMLAPATCLAWPTVASSQQAGRFVDGVLRHDGRERTYRTYVPVRRPAAPALVLALHGSGGDGRRLHAFLGGALEALADERGFLVAYPDGVGGGWNGCRAKAATEANRLNVDDVGFVRALVDRLAREHGVDRARVYALGFSGGGHLALRLALEAADLVEAVAVFAANAPVPAELDCRVADEPARVLLVNGTHDPINPFGGGLVRVPDGRTFGSVRSARESAEWLARLGGFPGAGVAEDGSGCPGVAERVSWPDAQAPAVVLVVVRGGGHAVPGPRSALPEVVGRVERDFDGTAEALRFFLETGGRS